jgi:hypothetical protein
MLETLHKEDRHMYTSYNPSNIIRVKIQMIRVFYSESIKGH